MRIKNHNYEVRKGITLKIDNRVSIPILDIKLLCSYINKLTYKKNGMYLLLLPTKINNLKELKNLLLKIRYKIKDMVITEKNIETEKQKENDLLMIFDKLKNNSDFKFMVSLGLIEIPKKEIKEIEHISNKKRIYNRDTSKRYHNFLLSVDYSIKFLERRINYYQKQLAHKKPIEQFKINSYDLIQLSDKLLTDNVKKLIYFYLIKLRKMRISNITYNYLTHKKVNEIIQNYNNSLIVNDLEDYISKELSLFSNTFLNRTI